MKIKYLTIVLLFFSVTLSNALLAQRSYDVRLPSGSLNVEECYFYIDQVIDQRVDTTKIGTVRKGPMNTPADGVFLGYFYSNLIGVFKNGLPYETDFIPLTMVVKEFEILETDIEGYEQCVFKLDAEFLFDGEVVFTYNWATKTRTSNALTKHGDNIVKGLEFCLQELSSTLYAKGLYGGLPYKYSTKEYNEETADYRSTGKDETTEKVDLKNRNVRTLGYQIGGVTLLGFNYEVRLSDAIGIHAGAGIRGYTAGLKIHTRADKKAPFINLSYKDGGFGLIQGAAAEYGGTLLKLNKNTDLGLHFQIGIMGIIYLDPGLERQLFRGGTAPDAIVSVGVGLSW